MRVEHERQCARLVSEKVPVRARLPAPCFAVVGQAEDYCFGKAETRVRFPPTAPFVVLVEFERQNARLVSGIVRVRVPSPAPRVYGVRTQVASGQAVNLLVAGSIPVAHPNLLAVRQWCWCGLQNRVLLIRLQPRSPRVSIWRLWLVSLGDGP